jgi:hypothetical protein
VNSRLDVRSVRIRTRLPPPSNHSRSAAGATLPIRARRLQRAVRPQSSPRRAPLGRPWHRREHRSQEYVYGL